MEDVDFMASGEEGAQAGGPEHAHLWLPPHERDAWLVGNKMSAMAAFSSVMGFWLLHMMSIRILNRRKQVEGARRRAELQHASGALLHSMLAVAAGFYLLIYRDLSACSERTFCFEEQSWLLMDLHVGFLVYEFIFYHNHAFLLKPQYGMLLLHHTIFVMGYLLTKMYPCKLSLELLPFYQLAGVAGIFDALRMLLNQLGAPAHWHFNNLLAMMAAFALRCAMAAMLAFKTYAWIKANNLWALDLPEDQSILAIPYGVLFIAGSWVVLLIYIKWLAEGTEMVNNLVSAIERQRAKAEEEQQQGGSGRGGKANGSGKDKKRQ